MSSQGSCSGLGAEAGTLCSSGKGESSWFCRNPWHRGLAQPTLRVLLLTNRHRKEQLGAGKLMNDKVYSHGIWAMARAGGDSVEFVLRDEKTTESRSCLWLCPRGVCTRESRSCNISKVLLPARGAGLWFTLNELLASSSGTHTTKQLAGLLLELI